MKLGLITTGQGPRDQYAIYHQRLAAALGITIETDIEHILDPLDWDQIRPHVARDGALKLGAHVHVPGATGNRLGPGWDHVYVDMAWSIAYFQQAIDRLVERGATMIVLCCAAKFEDAAFRSSVPLIRPSTLTFSLIADLVRTRGQLRLGVMSSAGHAEQDVALWREQHFAADITLQYEPFEGDLRGAAAKLSQSEHDIVVIWSYGLGTSPSDPEMLSAGLETTFGCPVLMPHRIAALHALSVLPAGFDDKAFAV